jgi:spore coat polysaccharide biosynthesis protein SpsF
MKIVIFVPVRLGSTRLPGKALIDIDGTPALIRLVERLRQSKRAKRIVVCTTKNAEDDKLVELGKKSGFDVFRGSENDILVRFLDAAKAYDVEFIVNVDGDDVLCDPLLVDEMADYYANEKTKPDFVKWKNLPLGIAPVGIRTVALEKVCEIKDTDKTDTGWGKYFTETGRFVVQELTRETRYSRPDIRLTLDYPEDLRLISEVFSRLGEKASLKDIVELFEKHPELLKINENVSKQYWERFNRMSGIKTK